MKRRITHRLHASTHLHTSPVYAGHKNFWLEQDKQQKDKNISSKSEGNKDTVMKAGDCEGSTVLASGCALQQLHKALKCKIHSWAHLLVHF